MSRTTLIVLALLCVAGFFVMARRASESRDSEQLPDGKSRSGSREESLEDSIDWEELRKAEDEIRGVDPMAKPEDGFEGDEWGPGTTGKT
ncbi:MAG TPA: hypothetical protein VEH62_04770 [Gemmatimonadales bacterium]|nr:hypothetical protein [Gemmatimonadales bacterium]